MELDTTSIVILGIIGVFLILVIIGQIRKAQGKGPVEIGNYENKKQEVVSPKKVELQLDLKLNENTIGGKRNTEIHSLNTQLSAAPINLNNIDCGFRVLEDIPFIIFRATKKNLILKKGVSITFVFDSEKTIEITINKAPKSLPKYGKSLIKVEWAYELSDEEINLIKSENIKECYTKCEGEMPKKLGIYLSVLQPGFSNNLIKMVAEKMFVSE